MLLDVRLPDGDGLDVLRKLKELSPDTPVILMTAFSSVENAVEAMKLGAYSYVNKPFNLDDVALAGGAGARDEPAAPRGALAAHAAGPRLRLRRDHRRVAGDARGQGAAAAGGREPGVHRAADGRDRHRQGPGGQGDPLQQRPRGASRS